MKPTKRLLGVGIFAGASAGTTTLAILIVTADICAVATGLAIGDSIGCSGIGDGRRG